MPHSGAHSLRALTPPIARDGIASRDNVVGYAGYIWEPDLGGTSAAGMHLSRHRYYAPQLGRWISRDPIGYADGPSLYAYVAGSPTVMLDPSGLVIFSLKDAVNNVDDDPFMLASFIVKESRSSLDDAASWLTKNENPDRIRTLFSGHASPGNSGWAFAADARELDLRLLQELIAYKNDPSSVSDVDAGMYDYYLYILGLIFEHGGDRIIFFGCNTGRGPRGLEFLQAFRELGLLRDGQTVTGYDGYVYDPRLAGGSDFGWLSDDSTKLPREVTITNDPSEGPMPTPPLNAPKKSGKKKSPAKQFVDDE